MFALAPIGCGCDAQLKAAGLAAHRHNLRFYLVDRTLPPLPAGLTDATAVRLVEPTGTVARKYDAETAGSRVAGGPVLVFVAADGQVAEVLPKADREHAGARAVEASSRRRRPPADRRDLYGGRRGNRPRAGPGLPPGADRGRDRGGGGAGRCRRPGRRRHDRGRRGRAGRTALGRLDERLPGPGPRRAGAPGGQAGGRRRCWRRRRCGPRPPSPPWPWCRSRCCPAGWPAACTWSRSPRPGRTTCGSRRPCCPCCRTRSRSGCCPPSSPPACPATRCTAGWSRRARCSAPARTSPTCCRTSTTTWPPASAGCRTGSAPPAPGSPPGRCSRPPRWCSPSARRDRRARSGSPPSWSPSWRLSAPGCSGGGRDRGRPSSACWWSRRSTWRCWSPPAGALR